MLTPEGSTITFIIDGTSSTIYITEVDYTFVTELFDRNEFVHEKERSAKELNGTMPIFVQKLGGGIVQLNYTCNPTTARPVTPDDSDLTNIKQRWDIHRWTIRGDHSLSSAVQSIFPTAVLHKQYLAQYQTRLAEAQSDVSITLLESFQGNATPFNNLVSTGITVTGNSIGYLTNCLIADMQIEVVKETPLDDEDITFQLYEQPSFVIEQRVYLPASD